MPYFSKNSSKFFNESTDFLIDLVLIGNISLFIAHFLIKLLKK